MLTFRLNNCVDCATIPVLLEQIDCKLTELAKNQYNNIVFALNYVIDSTLVLDLLNYKRILVNKTCNADYASYYSTEEIAGKVRILIYK